MRPDELPRPRRHRAHARSSTATTKRGFELVVGGGLGAVPQAAQRLRRVPARGGAPPDRAGDEPRLRAPRRERNRARARFKFVVKKLGIEEIKRLVLEERAKLPPGSALDGVPRRPARHRREAAPAARRAAARRTLPDGFDAWRETNVVAAAPAGLRRWPIVTLPLGDLTSEQGRALADIARRSRATRCARPSSRTCCCAGSARPTCPRSIGALVRDATSRSRGAGTIGDITACPGTDTCKLGISSSRALAAELTQAAPHSGHRPTIRTRKHLHIKTSGCFNSCGQHHVADLGFLGRQPQRRRPPRAALPARRRRPVDEQRRLVRPGHRRRAVEARARGRQAPDGALRARSGRGRDASPTSRTASARRRSARWSRSCRCCRRYEQDPSYYSDWGDPREYTIADMGEGECAGEVVPYVEVELAAARARDLRGADAARRAEDRGRGRARLQRRCCRRRARSTREKNPNVGTAPDEIVGEFRKHYYDTQLFFDPFAGGKFAQYFFRAHEERAKPRDRRDARTSSSRRRRSSSTPPTSATRASAPRCATRPSAPAPSQ